jgi:signal transduction histidine kinase
MIEFNLMQIFDDLPFPAVIYLVVDDGADFIFEHVNKESRNVDGIDLDLVIGKKITECFPGVEEFGLLKTMHDAFHSGKREHLPTTLYQDEKLSGYRENWVFRLDDKRVMAIYQDRDDYIKIYESLEEQKTIALQSAQLASVGEMSASISHEIRNPLTIITGRLRILLRKLPEYNKEDIYNELEKMKLDTKKIATIMNSVLNLSRGFHEESKEETTAEEIVNNCLPYIENFVEKYQVSLSTSTSISIGTSFECIPIQVQQVVTNLLRNAIEHVYDMEEAWVHLETFIKDGEIHFMVTDSGPAIPDEIKGKIGTKLFTTKGKKGTGLGVFLSRKIAQEHGGSLTIDNINNHPCFDFHFPIV